MSPGTRPEPEDGLWPQVEDGPVARFRLWPAVVAALMIAVLLLASAAGFRFLESERLPFVSNGPVIAGDTDSGGWPEADVVGTLTLRGGCLLVDDEVAYFAAGTTWSESDQAVILNDGSRWQLGDRIVAGGGYYPVGSVPTDYGEEPAAAAQRCATDLGVDGVVLVGP